ncbi:MAG: alpha-L-fucosidase [Parabacteroides sp.]
MQKRSFQKQKKAGFKYIVFTTKHHDGYTLWPSKYSDLGVNKK